jgi:hypothetical protein
MMMAAFQMNVLSAEQEEERMLMRAIEESKFDGANDPTAPDVDNMTYEQLMELGEKAGKVNQGLGAF